MGLSPQAAFLLACILMSDTNDNDDGYEVAVLTQIMQRMVGSRKSPHWIAAWETWESHSEDQCIEFIGRYLPKPHTLSLMANLADMGMAAYRMPENKKLLIAKIGVMLDAGDYDLETYMQVIHEKNALFTA